MNQELLRLVARRIAYHASAWPHGFWKDVGRITFQVLVRDESLNIEVSTTAFTDNCLRLCVGVDDGTEPSVTISETSEVDIYADRDEAYTALSILSMPGLLSELSVDSVYWGASECDPS